MDKRKIILFGKSAYCLTLPQAWVKKNNFKKGDLLGVQETHRNSLELIPQNTGKAASIRKYVHEFIAAEVMDVTPDKIVINVLWNTKRSGRTGVFKYPCLHYKYQHDSALLLIMYTPDFNTSKIKQY